MTQSSLALQLKKLHESAPPPLSNQAQKTRPSLLFDARQAAHIDLETFYSIGIEGFSELVKMDERIRAFEASLFSRSSKELERELLTK
jgi:U3 small nucleolar RNA-associated protein 10